MGDVGMFTSCQAGIATAGWHLPVSTMKTYLIINGLTNFFGVCA
jgi:hypothetical protein